MMELAAMEAKLAQLEEEIRNGAASRKEIYDRLIKLETENARTDEKYKRIMDELSEQKKQLSEIGRKLDQLSQKPAKRWDAAVSSLVSAVIGGVTGFFINSFMR